jgi:rhamnogalacturonyl hydrolase YesR
MLKCKKIALIVLILFVFRIHYLSTAEEKQVEIKVSREWRFDFGTAETQPDFISVDNVISYSPEKGYGWITPPQHLRDRKHPNALLRDYVFSSSPAVFRVNVAPGLYRLTLSLGDMLYGDHFLKVSFSVKDVDVPVINPQKMEFATVTLSLSIPDKTLDIFLDSPANNWALNALTLEPIGKPEEMKIKKKKFKEPAQDICLPETDPNSPRRSRLQLDNPLSGEVVRIDADGDGDPDILETWWNWKCSRWFDENDDMKEIDLRGDMVDDSVQIDRDGDGYYDGPDDMNIDWVDNDNDGDADLQVIAINPSKTQPAIQAASSHYMIFEDVDDDNVHGYINWENFDFPCWRFTGKGNFSPDYNGNSIFLKEHLPAFAISDPRYNWENPFAFYDFDDDGATEMAIRFCDGKIQDSDSQWHYDGLLEESFVTYDLDNDAQRNNEMDYDMTLRFADGKKLDYNRFINKFPKLKAADWILPYFRYTNWRMIDELVYVPHGKCYDEIFKPEWGRVWLVFDEDDDDHRWERVEMYYPGDPYITSRWGENKGRGLPGHPQSDTLGDRGEYDEDYSGKGKLYIGKWDGKIHLYGAEWGAWLVDYGARYWGSWPVTGDSSPERADKVEELIQYYDTNENGFFDRITYDYDGDKKVDFEVSLLKYKDEKNPEPDKCEIIEPSAEKWQGMHELFQEISEKSWQEALFLYRVIWKKGLNTAELDDLAICSSTNEKYEHAFWLKEKILRRILPRIDGKNSESVLKFYYTGDIKGLALFLDELKPSEIKTPEKEEKKDMFEPKIIRAIMKKTFRYMLTHPIELESANWERGAFYTGIMGAYQVTKDEEYLDQAIKWSKENNWELNKNRLGYWFADNQTCSQTYLDIYFLKGGEEKIAHVKKIVDEMAAKPPKGREEWWWCDSLYMAPAAFVRLSKAAGDEKYTRLMNDMWWDSTEFLYDPEEHLYFRDKNFFDKTTRNGRKIFWARGNGWVMGGIVRVLEFLPKDNPKRNDFIALHKEMSEKIASIQGKDGLWRTSLLDFQEDPMPETSGTGFYCYSIARGINMGHLDREKYEPVVRKAWEGLCSCVSEEGRLGWVQQPAASPTPFSNSSTHEYGVGAFLLAGSEMLKLLGEK